MKIKIIKYLMILVCSNVLATQPINRLVTCSSGSRSLHKVMYSNFLTKPQPKNNMLKLGASLSTLALLCHIGYNIPAKKYNPEK